MIFAQVFKFVLKCQTEEGGQGVQMEAAFRHMEKEGVIGSEEKEHRKEAQSEGLSKGGGSGDHRRGKDQRQQNEYAGESIQEDERLKEA
jgi:hypothetical protein